MDDVSLGERMPPVAPLGGDSRTDAGPADLEPAIRALETQFARMGKEYYRANVLAESRQKSLEQLLEQQSQVEQRRERELSELRERLAGERAAGRRDVIEALLPVVDGLQDAVDSGFRLLDRESPTLNTPERLRAALTVLTGGTPTSSSITGDAASASRAWLEGVRLVLERARTVLADAGVHPIPTVGTPFDPHLHVAVGVEPASPGRPAGTIVREARRGYRQGETVLRFAEVAVTRGGERTPRD